MPDLTLWKDLATVVGAAVALAMLVKGVVEYVSQGKQRRVERFLALREQLDREEKFSTIADALEEEDTEKLKTATPADKRHFLGLFEQVALMMNSGFISKPVAHYMFGYYAIAAWESSEFWEDMEPGEKQHPYWALFAAFVREMMKQRTELERVHSSPDELWKLLGL